LEQAFWKSFAQSFDADGSGDIQPPEFSAMVGAIHHKLTDEQIAEFFKKADTDHDGTVSFDQVFQLISNEAELHAQLLAYDPNFLWHIYAKSDDYNTVGNLVLGKNLIDSHKTHVHQKEMNKVIRVHNRLSGELEEEKIPHYIEVALRIMYSTKGVRTAVENHQIRKLLHHLTASQGKKYEDERSKKEIPTFIKFHELNVDEIRDPLDSFKNFNEFFYRKLKPSARPVASPDNPKVAVSPADSRLNVFPTITDATRLWIKGQNFTVGAVLQDNALAKKFDGGSLVIARLAPQDYHRFHFPIDCSVGGSSLYDGAYFTVNPIAIRENVDVYTENKRMKTILKTSEFGEVVYMAIGATMVGSIQLTSKEGQKYKKGDEHGYFAFGGSTILLFFEPGVIKFDHDLLSNSQKSVETLVKVGDSIGVSTR